MVGVGEDVTVGWRICNICACIIRPGRRGWGDDFNSLSTLPCTLIKQRISSFFFLSLEEVLSLLYICVTLQKKTVGGK